MSAEDFTWLNTNVLIGYTSKRGTAWHYRASEQGAEPNHYGGAVPVEDVERRLFGWRPVVGEVMARLPDGDGDGGVRLVPDPAHRAVVRPDTGTVLGVVGAGYAVHDYSTWLLGGVASLLGTAGIGSAGLLVGGAKAWVQVEVPETLSTPEGVAFRPFLTAATSLDGRMATTYLTGAQVVVCDNTLRAALREDDARALRIRHSAHSMLRLDDARRALDLIDATGQAFAAQVREQCATAVSDAQWKAFLAAHFPLADPAGRSEHTQRAKRALVDTLWRDDERVSPWKGTAYGVVAAVNTYEHHVAQVRGRRSRAERNAQHAVGNRFSELDAQTMATLRTVLAR